MAVLGLHGRVSVWPTLLSATVDCCPGMKAPSLLSVSPVNILLFPCYGENWIAPGYLHDLLAPHFLGSRDCEILTPGQKVAIIKKKIPNS